ncbi:hypothetical protein [Runella slithyformis]|nr:hypothetical protein [Runella slithyformis]
MLLGAVAGCTPACDVCEEPLSGVAFFPTEIGSFVEYDVVEEEYTLGKGVMIRQYQWKEVMAERYTDPMGQPVYRIARYRRTAEGKRWTADSTVMLRLATDYAVRNENGKDYVKMVFPPLERKVWNGNLYNTGGDDSYELIRVNKPYTVGKMTFDRTATVVQQDDSTLVNRDSRVEVYAAGVGLVYRESILLQFCSSAPTCIGKAQIDFGTRRYIRFRNAGKE